MDISRINFDEVSDTDLLALKVKINSELEKRGNPIIFPTLDKKVIEDSIKFYNSIESHPDTIVRKESNIGQGYLTKESLLQINKWKNRTERNKHHFDNISDQEIQNITKEAFNAKSDADKLEKLKSIPGIGYPTASAILMMYDPKRFGVYDVRATRVLYHLGLSDKRLVNENASDIIEYYNIIRDLAKKYGKSARDIDKALFALDKQYGGTIS